MRRQGLLVVVAIAAAALAFAAISLGAMTSPTRSASVAAAAGHRGATETAVKYRIVRRCRVKRVRRAGKVVRRKVCRRVRVRVTPKPKVPPVTTTSVPTTPSVPTATTPTTNPTDPLPPAQTLLVREVFDGTLKLILPAASVPSGTYVIRRRIEGGTHNLVVQKVGDASAALTFPLLSTGEDAQNLTLTPGQWRFRCTVPGHEAMDQTLTVT